MGLGWPKNHGGRDGRRRWTDAETVPDGRQSAGGRRGRHRGGLTVRAREWAIAGQYREPADYDIPELPAWHVRRPDCGGIAFAAGGEPFIVAERPMKVRR